MAKQTHPHQPIIYDMMLLVDSLVTLSRLRSEKPRTKNFCDRQKNLEVALAKIRCLAQFLGEEKSGSISVANQEFGGTLDKTYMKFFDRISKHVLHPMSVRWLKPKKYPQVKAKEAIKIGKDILGKVEKVMALKKGSLRGDAVHWYRVFEERYTLVQNV